MLSSNTFLMYLDVPDEPEGKNFHSEPSNSVCDWMSKEDLYRMNTWECSQFLTKEPDVHVYD